MRNGLDHAADGLVIHALDNLVEPRKAKPFDHKFVLDRKSVV